MDHSKRDRCQSAAIQEVIIPRVFCRLQLYAGQEPPHGLPAVVIQSGGVHSFGVLWVDNGGAGETQGLVPRLKVDLGFVTAPRAIRDADDRLAAGGNA